MALKLAALGLSQSKDTRQKPASMLKVERSPSHSWWWDSHNSPKHSKWLQSNLQDLDEKVKEMLRLIEEDADSFAQRAEMYYQKRPELLNLVEEFYRAYRSLAERYDHLTGEIRQNIPRALQVQYGLSCDSPSANRSRHHYSPLRKSNQMFENVLTKSCQMEDQAKQSDKTGDYIQSLQGKCADNDACIENGGHDDPCADSQHNSSDGGLSSSSSDSEVDNLTPLTRLQEEIDELKESNRVLEDSHQRALQLNSSLNNKVKELEEGYKSKKDELKESNRVLADSHQRALQLNSSLNNKVKELEEGYKSKKHEADALRSKLDALSENLLQFRSVSKEQHSVGVVNDVQEKELQVEILPYLEEELDSCTGDEDACESADLFKDANMAAECKHEHHSIELKSMQEQTIALLDGMQNHIAQLKEENRKQKVVILERGEEKLEAIRQLCFSMDVMKSKNQRLEVILGLLKKKLNSSNARVAYRSPSPAWKQLFSVGDWRILKRGQPFVAVAL